MGLTPQDYQALWLAIKLAAVSSLILLLLASPLAWWLATTRSRLKHLVETLVALPLVLPPSVMGFYLLVFLGPQGLLGGTLEDMGLRHLAFTFTGLVIGSVVYSLPFAVQPLQNAFEAIRGPLLEVAATLRAGPVDRFFSVALPLARRGFLTAAVLSFAHTLGEFGVVLMIGGNIPGQTQVVSIAIYDHVESMNYNGAAWLSGVLLLFSFVVLLLVYGMNRRLPLVKY